MIVWKFKSFTGDGLMHILQMLSQSLVYMAKPSQINDVIEGRWIDVPSDHQGDLDTEWGNGPSAEFFKARYEVNEEIKKHRFASFCRKQTVTHPLMWGHYGGGGNGVAIAYDLSEIDTDKVYQVLYTGVPVIDRDGFMNAQNKVEYLIVNGVLRSKEPCWEIEGEVRVIKAPGDVINKCGDEEFMSLEPKGIVIGCAEESPQWRTFSSLSHHFKIPFGYLVSNTRVNQGFHVSSQDAFFSEFEE